MKHTDAYIEQEKYRADLCELYEADDEPYVRQAFSKAFGIEPEMWGAGLAVSSKPILDISDYEGNDDGIYFQKESGHMVYVMCRPSNIMTDFLQIDPGCTFVVYTDSYEEEGPFIGSPSPVNEFQTFGTWQEAKAEFIKQMHEA